ncbi:hypothetical protein PXH69_24390 [Rhodococcus qingshengii]|uniref:Uncharacterized protein n=1 Tax=Rhodococcus qingshengii TaxID=334542 RepID=A0AAW6LVS1_RHOSG|nr:hypothetical protein [Rhodococcus qingshengii]MDE8648110.1 hypothetical protein [Rhodococcus qingshengii]
MTAVNLQDMEARAREILAKVQASDYTCDLVHIDRGDGLGANQMVAYLADRAPDSSVDFDSIVDVDWYCESRHSGMIFEFESLISGNGFDLQDLEDAFPALHDSIREAIEESDSSDPAKDLAGASGSHFFQFHLKDMCWDEVDVDDAESVKAALEMVGLPDSELNRAAVVEAVVNQFSYLKNVMVFGHLDLTDAGDLQEHGGTITDPWLVTMDSWSGACALAKFEGTIRVDAGSVHLDSEFTYGSVDNICGLSAGHFGIEFQVAPKED